MIKAKKATIIVISFNQEKYIEETINSLLNQKTTFDYSIFISDDCSNDKTYEKCLAYQKKYPSRINLISHNKNLGMMKNIIFAYENCDTEYVAICEGDDYWTDQNKLQKQVDFLEDNRDYGLVFSDSDALDVKNNNIIRRYFSKRHKILDGKITEDLILNSFIPTPTVCYRYKFVDSFLKSIDPIKEGWKMFDTPLAIYVSHYSKSKYLPISTSMYRIHPSSSSNFLKFDQKIEFLLSKIKMKMFFAKRFDLSNKIYRKVLSSSFLSFLSIIYNNGFPKKSNKKVQLILFFYESIKQILIKKILKIK